jgi:carboxyl-terminal processing protease
VTHRLVLAFLSLVVALALTSAACSPSPTSGAGSQRATTSSAPVRTGEARPELATALLTPNQLQGVYQLILQRFIDRVDHELLLDSARAGVQAALHEAGALPLDTSIVAVIQGPSASAERDWSAFATAYDALTRKYPEWATTARLDHLIVRRMMESLADRHSLFISPSDYRRRNETGYSGIGVRLSQPVAGQAPRIVEVFPDTPAAQRGLRAGDRIVAVEGQPIAGLPLANVVEQIRGPEGSTVNMDVERPGARGAVRVSLTRRAVEIPYVEAGLIGPIGYLRIRGFTETVPLNAAGMLTEGQRLGAQAWIVDLRGNSGGRVTAVQAVAGMFVEQKTIGIEVNRARERNPLISQGPRIVGDVPLVVMIDGESTSGAEILAAALKEHRGAILIGERSAGNVAVAEEHVLPDGSAIQLTVRRFLGPSGGNLDRVGVQPDVTVGLADSDLAAGQDPQLARAVEELQGRTR